MRALWLFLVALGCGMGFWLGRTTAPTPTASHNPAPQPQPPSPSKKTPPIENDTAASIPPQEGRQPSPPIEVAHKIPETGRESEGDPISENLQNLLRELEALRGANPDDLFQKEGFDLSDRLLGEMMRNDAALERVLEMFQGADETTAAVLAVALGQYKHPRIEETALQLALSGASDSLRLRGFDLLDRLDIATSETVQAITRSIPGESNPNILAAAIYALPQDGVTSPEDRRSVLAALSPLLMHSNIETRKRAAMRFTEWARTLDEIAPVMKALTDGSPDVRAAAAFALQHYRGTEPSVMQALVERVGDSNEDTEVRRQAWLALRHFPMDPETWTVYDQFRNQLESQP